MAGRVSLFLLFLVTMGTMTLKAKSIQLLGAKSKSPVELANICFLRGDSTVVTTALSDTTGLVTLPADNAIRFCRITALGYNELLKEMDAVRNESKLYLEEKSTDLGELEVIAKKKPYIMKPDRIVFNPEFAAFATSAYDIVCAAPGVLANDGTVSIPSKQGVKILINNKEQRGSLADVMNILKTYPSSDIKSVEVITAPSTRYTRGNDIGVINIILKRKVGEYLGGNASYTLAARPRIQNTLSGALNYRTDKLSASLNAYGYISPDRFEEDGSIQFDETVRKTHSDIERDRKGVNVRASVDYTFSPKWEAYLTYNFNAYENNHDADGHDDFLHNASLYDSRDVKSHRYDRPISNYLFGEATGRLSDKTTLTTSIDYYHITYPSARSQINGLGETDLSQDNENRSSKVTGSANLNWTLSKALTLNFGADYFHTETNNDSEHFYLDEGTFSQNLHYTENEVSVFGQIQYSFASKWYLNGTLKYQHISAKNKLSEGMSDRYSWNSSDLHPSVSLSYMLNNKNSFRLSYYSNTNKPSLANLNPTMLYVGNDTYRVGNPYLHESRHYYASLTYSFGNLMIEPYFEMLNDGIAETGAINDDGILTYTWGNFLNVRTGGLYIYWGWNALDWMSFSVPFVTTYNHSFSTDERNRYSLNSWHYSFYPRLQFFLDKRKKFTLSVNGSYRSKHKMVDVVTDPYWTMSASMVWRPTNQWTVSLSADNILYTNTKGYSVLTNSNFYFDNRYTYRGVSLSATFTWGKSAKFKMANNTQREMEERTKVK